MKQLSLSLFDNDDNHNANIVYLKRYIQPFEGILAQAELQSLLGEEGTDHFSEPFQDYFELPSNIKFDKLKSRLAYWERLVIDGSEIITHQAILELTDGTDRNAEALTSEIDAEELHQRRKLRYGPHDLHEYRGKFFPQLVRACINIAGLEEGSIVLDPFCGSGTTLVEARALGMHGIGLDLNPLSILIADAKASIMSVSSSNLEKGIANVKERIKKNVDVSITDLWSKSDLHYLNRWFDELALQEVAQIRGAIEDETNSSLKKLFQVSLSNIIRTVSWQKISDLRVRKEITDYQQGSAFELFKNELDNHHSKLSTYLDFVKHHTNLLDFEVQEADARNIRTVFSEYASGCDVLITSPPYATALPYIDTDRLSLIVLGLLPRSKHREREYEMVGNREITEAQRQELWETYQTRKDILPQEVNKLIEFLGENNHTDRVGFRRRNLPALLSKYYLDMFDCMVEARKMMKPGSLAFYVVGNNSTNVGDKRIEIPTDSFIWQIGERAGWHKEKFIDMDMLPSRDIFKKNSGSSESILVFRSTVRRKSIYGTLSSEDINDSEWDFHDSDTQEHLHSLHPYPAKFIPQIPRKAIAQYTSEGDVVLDPFCGSGTAVLEAQLLGRIGIGIDNNAVAELVSRAKTTYITQENVESLSKFLRKFPTKRSNIVHESFIPDYRNRDHWFSENALLDLGFIKSEISKLDEPLYTLALATMSAIVVRVSFQDSDTRYAKIDRQYQEGSALKWFKNKLKQVVGDLQNIVGKQISEASVHLHDSRAIPFIDNSSVDLVVTSPPYLNAYDYHKYHRHRLHWIEGDVAFARDMEIGKHDQFTRPNAEPEPYFNDMTMCFQEWYRVLKPSGKVLIVVGDAIVSGNSVSVGDKFIEIFQSLDFSLKSRWLRNLQTTRKSFNQQSRMRQEHVLLFEK